MLECKLQRYQTENMITSNWLNCYIGKQASKYSPVFSFCAVLLQNGSWATIRSCTTLMGVR